MGNSAIRPKKLMKEPGSPRGLVPTSTYGRLDEAYNEYLGTLDPRGKGTRSKALQLALATAADRRFNEFLSKLYEPQYGHYSLAALAKSCDIGLTEFAEFWRKAQTQRALAIAQDALPAVTQDIVEDARAKDVPCESCNGLGIVQTDPELSQHCDGFRQLGTRYVRTCPQCEGSGRATQVGDREAQKLILDMGGLTNKKGPAISLVQNFGGMTIESAVDRLNRITFDPGDDIIEAEE